MAKKQKSNIAEPLFHWRKRNTRPMGLARWVKLGKPETWVVSRDYITDSEKRILFPAVDTAYGNIGFVSANKHGVMEVVVMTKRHTLVHDEWVLICGGDLDELYLYKFERQVHY